MGPPITFPTGDPIAVPCGTTTAGIDVAYVGWIQADKSAPVRQACKLALARRAEAGGLGIVGLSPPLNPGSCDAGVSLFAIIDFTHIFHRLRYVDTRALTFGAALLRFHSGNRASCS